MLCDNGALIKFIGNRYNGAIWLIRVLYDFVCSISFIVTFRKMFFWSWVSDQ